MICRRTLLLIASVSLLGCPRTPDSTSSDAATAAFDASVDAGFDTGSVAAIDAGPISLAVTVVATTLDGGAEPITFIDNAATIEPARGFDLLVTRPLRDYRVRVLDQADEVVPSDDVAQPSDGGLTYRIDLVQPLRPAHTYTLIVDSEFGPEITDAVGHTFDDVRLTLKIAGEPTPEPGKAPKKRHH